MKNLFSNFNRLLLLGLAVMMVGNVWGTYTITFKSGTTSTDGSTAQTTIANLISDGSGYVSSISATNAYNAKKDYGIKLGASKKTGNVEMTMASSGSTIGQVKASSMSMTAAYYDNGKTLKVTVTYTDATTSETTVTPTSNSMASYAVTVNSTKTISKIKIATVTATSGRMYVGSVTVTTASGYDITYECNGATSGCPEKATGQSTLPNPLPDAPVKAGNEFGGWFTNSGLTTAAVAGASISANTTLYAKWNPIHTVKVQATSSWSNTISAWVFPVGSDGSWATVTEEGFWYKFSVPDGYKFIIANGTGWAAQSAESAAITADGCYWAAKDVLSVLDCCSTTYYIKHPWNGGDWTWQTMSGTGDTRTFTGQWGNNGVNINIASGNDNKLAKWIEAASITKPAGLTSGTSVVFTYTISTGAVTVSVPVTSVSLNKNSMSLKTTASETLTATVEPSAASQTVNWTSSDETVATVSNGTVTAKKAGTATITATSTSDNTKKATCTVTVTDPVVTASANDGDLGSVSVSGNVITASPNPCVGYANDAYSVTAGTVASVVKNNNTFTVTASTDCSITINFVAQKVDTYTDNLHGQSTTRCGNGYTIPVLNEGDKTTGDECQKQHYHFVGWSASTITPGVQDEPQGLIKSGTKDATGTTYYAVWAKEQ